ncbi:MAG: hypothetical protein KFKLKKLM_02414 [Flavobacteriales bacterium]|nr:hypothetical protein [Flavobacteriales bacterium]
MYKFFLITICLSFSIFASAQQKGNPNNEQTIFVKANGGKEVNLDLNLFKYDLNTIGQLKDDLFKFYPNKIVLIQLDEFKKILTIKYNDKLVESEFVSVFYENNVSFLRKDKIESNSSEY